MINLKVDGVTILLRGEVMTMVVMIASITLCGPAAGKIVYDR